MSAVIRFARLDDCGAITEIYRPFCASSAVSFESEAPSTEEIRERIHVVGSVYPWIVLDDRGVVAGYAYASRHRARAAYRWSVEVTAYVAPGFRGRGAGRALYESLFAVLRRLGYCKAYAGIALPNPASVALHTAAGFAPVGIYRGVGYKLGRWHDVAWYQMTLQAEPAFPADPVPLASAGESIAWREALAVGLLRYQSAEPRAARP